MDDIIKFGFVVAMLLAVGTFTLFMIPIFLRNYRKANLVGREPQVRVERAAASATEPLVIPAISVGVFAFPVRITR